MMRTTEMIETPNLAPDSTPLEGLSETDRVRYETIIQSARLNGKYPGREAAVAASIVRESSQNIKLSERASFGMYFH